MIIHKLQIQYMTSADIIHQLLKLNFLSTDKINNDIWFRDLLFYLVSTQFYKKASMSNKIIEY